MQAGAARRDITPRDPVFLVGYPHVERMSTGVHDPLEASAVCLSDGSRGILLLALDVLFLTRRTATRIREGICAACPIDPAAVLVSCTHTHSGPVTHKLLAWSDDPVVPEPDPAYLDWLVARAVEAGVAAWSARRPARLRWASARAPLARTNRLDPTGAEDHRIGLLQARDAATGATLALVVIHGLHPTVLHEDSTEISADFPGFMRARLHGARGRDAVIAYHTAPSGNLSPRYIVRDQTFDSARELGFALADAVLAALQAGDEPPAAPMELDYALGQIDGLPLRTFPTVEEALEHHRRAVAHHARLAAEGAERGRVRTAECAVFGAEERITLARAQADGRLARAVREVLPAPLQVLRVGPRLIVGWPGEVFVEHSLAFQRRCPMEAHVIELANGELEGYVVTEEADRLQTYESQNSLFPPVAGEMLIDATLALVADLLRGDSPAGET